MGLTGYFGRIAWKRPQRGSGMRHWSEIGLMSIRGSGLGQVFPPLEQELIANHRVLG